LEEKLKNEEAKNRAGNQEKIQQSAIQEKNEDLEKIKNELGKEGGAGHVFGEDDRRKGFNEEEVRRILRGLEAGLTEINFKERIRIAFFFVFRFDAIFIQTKFNFRQNLEVREGGWYLRHQSNCGGDGFWKIWLTRNGKNF